MSKLFGGGSNDAAKKQQKQFEEQQRLAAEEKAAAAQKVKDDAARQAEGRAIGRASTMLTGGRGLMDDESAKRYLI